MAEKPAWLSYLELSKAVSNEKYKPRTFDYGITAPLSQFGERLAENPDLAKAQKQYETAKLQAQALGIAEPGAPKKGVISKALDVITFLPSVATSAIKEFVWDPLSILAYEIQNPYLTPEQRAAAGDREKVSLDEFRKNVKERNFAQEMYGFLEYDKDAPIWEKALKEIGGLGIDIASTGGFGSGVRVASALGRKVAASQLDNAAIDIFKKNAVKLADETDDQFATRAADFAAKASTAQLEARSRGVRDLFKKEFTEIDPKTNKVIKDGDDVFKQLPKELQGGVQLYYRGKNIASLNAGGRLTDKVAQRLGVGNLTNTTDKAVKAYQNTKNILRADALKTPGVNYVVGSINKVLNNVGGERSRAWSSYIGAIANNAKDEDVIVAFKGFRAIDEITNFRNLRTDTVRDTNQLFEDLVRFKKIDEAGFNRAIDYMKNPQKVLLANANDVKEDAALAYANRYRNEFDRYREDLVNAGLDVGYLDEYLPLLFTKVDDHEKITTYLKQGLKNVGSEGYNPEIARTKFLKDKIDPFTKKVIYQADNVTPVKVPMTPTEVKDYFVTIGRKDLADLVEDDPLNMLARYATNVSKISATKKLVNSLLNRGVLFKSTAMQLYPDTELLLQATKNMPPNELTKIVDDFVGAPGEMSKWLENLNDDLVIAFNTGDQQVIQKVKDEVGTFIDSLKDVRGGLNTYIAGLRKNKTKLEKEIEELQSQTNLFPDQEILLSKKAQLASIEDDILSRSANRTLIMKEQKRISDQVKGKLPDPTQETTDIVGGVLAQREGIKYISVGASEYAQEISYYLKKQLAGLTGEKELVGVLDRFVTVQKGKKGTGELMQSVDEYLQFFRAGATFGRLSGFVLRNGYGAIQNNFVIAGSTARDHKVAREVAQTRLFTDVAMQPLATLTRKDKVTKRIDNLIDKGKLTESQAKRLRDDVDVYDFVQAKTIADIRDEVIETKLSSKFVDDNISYFDVYKTGRDGGIYDRYVILPASQGLNADDEAVSLLGIDPTKTIINTSKLRKILGQAVTDPERIVTRTTRLGGERKRTQKISEGLLNFGVTISADTAGRKINLRPVQLTRDANQLMEEFVRLAPIVTGLRRYGKTEGGGSSAIMLMKAAQFDYSDLSDIERRVLRRALPFYTYMKNNVAAQTRILFNDPERIRRNLAGWEAVGDIMSDENGENYVIPDYIGEMYGFLIDEDLRKSMLAKSPWWLKELLQNPIAFRPESPVLDLERYSKGGFDNVTDELISSGNPIAKAIVQYSLQENLYSGREYTNEDPAPNWYVALDKIIPGNILGVETNEKGEKVAPGRNIDLFKSLIPQIGTIERSGLPIVDAVIEVITGEPSDLGSTMSERAITNLLSQLGGINVVTITPDVEKSVYYNMRKNIEDTVNSIALDNGIDRTKLRDAYNKLRDKGYSPEDIVTEIERLRQQGALNSVAIQPIVGE
jgi:polyhydroxyalkanoate synthesis regulator phasin